MEDIQKYISAYIKKVAEDRENFTLLMMNLHLNKWHKFVMNYTPNWFKKWSFKGHVEIRINDNEGYYAVNIYGVNHCMYSPHHSSHNTQSTD